jgi:leader peptidase (prepilin peptidase)/N-methyltransferase
MLFGGQVHDRFTLMLLPGWAVLILGPVIGSWLGVIIRRYGTGQGTMWGRSACESCHAPLRAPDLIPLVSFLALRGRCRHCGAPISRFHPAVEAAALAIAAAAWAADGETQRVWVDAALGWALLTAAWIDAENYVLPDLITLPLLLAGLAATWWLQPGALTDHAAGAALGYLGFMSLNAAYRALRGHDGLGQGDAKLLAAAGAWLGASNLPDEILAAGLIGLASVFAVRLFGHRTDGKLPFGPALALACFALRLASG